MGSPKERNGSISHNPHGQLRGFLPAALVMASKYLPTKTRGGR